MRRLRHFFAVATLVVCSAILMGCEVMIAPDIARDELYGSWYHEEIDNSGRVVYKFTKELNFWGYDSYEIEANHYYDGFLDESSYFYQRGTFYTDGWGDLELTYDNGYDFITDYYDYEIAGNKLILTYYADGVRFREIYLRY